MSHQRQWLERAGSEDSQPALFGLQAPRWVDPKTTAIEIYALCYFNADCRRSRILVHPGPGLLPCWPSTNICGPFPAIETPINCEKY